MKKKLLVTLALALHCTAFVLAQQAETIFNYTMPAPFFGTCDFKPNDWQERANCCHKNVHEYIAQNIKYPEDAFNQGIEGRMVLSFVVKKDGSLTDIKVVKPLFPSLDSSAVAVVQNMPKWTAGQMDGKNVDARYTLPLKFKAEYIQFVDRFTTLNELFCDKYLSEMIPAIKLQNLAKQALQIENICNLENMPNRLSSLIFTYTYANNQEKKVESNGEWTGEMASLLSNAQAGDSFNLDFKVQFTLAEGKIFEQSEYKVIIVK